ncbi:MAG: hypothetical protein ACFBSD_06350 [Paracoccaceae bacterium]
MTRIAEIAALPDNQLTMLCRHVFLGERAVRYVEPTEEGILAVSCGEDDHGDGSDDWLTAGFGTLAARDPSLRACPPIPLGQAAEREAADAPWSLTEVAE